MANVVQNAEYLSCPFGSVIAGPVRCTARLRASGHYTCAVSDFGARGAQVTTLAFHGDPVPRPQTRPASGEVRALLVAPQLQGSAASLSNWYAIWPAAADEIYREPLSSAFMSGH